MDTDPIVVVPGDEVTHRLTSKTQSNIILGPGLRRVADKVYICNGGILQKKPNTYWVDFHRKRYIPIRDERVIGIVTHKATDFFKVDIGSSEPAILSYLAFEGATKKNRIKLEIGDLVYGKLLNGNRDMDPELVCIDARGKSHVLGVLSPDGYLVHCSIDLARKLLHEKCPFDRLGNCGPSFEYAVGVNGRIWVRSHSVQITLAVAQAMLACEFLSFNEIQKLCDTLKKQCRNL